VKLTPPDLVFGSQTVGTTSAPKHVQVTNSGSAHLTLSEIYLTGVDYKEFSQSNNCRAIVAAGASCTITVTFTPKTVGKRSAFIGLIDTGGGTPQTVTLAALEPESELLLRITSQPEVCAPTARGTASPF
jgi:hypothetical protein